MFLNNNIIKRLMKQAYKTGLAIAHTEERIYIAGSYWEMDVKRDFLPKQILAQIIELAGELPEVGHRFTATKEGNQEEIEMRMQIDASGYETDIEVTKLVLFGVQDTAQRILQDIRTGNTYIVNNAFVNIVDNVALEEDRGEYRVDKPFYNPIKGILWQNNVARFHAEFRSDDNHQRLLEEIQQIDLTEDIAE